MFNHTTLGECSVPIRTWLRTTATPHGDAAVALDLYDSDRIGSDRPIIWIDSVGWGLLRGYLNIYVEPAYRRHGFGEALVREFVRVHGSDLLFSTPDPSAERMFRKHL